MSNYPAMHAHERREAPWNSETLPSGEIQPDGYNSALEALDALETAAAMLRQAGLDAIARRVDGEATDVEHAIWKHEERYP